MPLSLPCRFSFGKLRKGTIVTHDGADNCCNEQQMSDWCVAGRRGKHKGQKQVADRIPVSQKANPPGLSLASLPAIAVASIFRHLQKPPASAVSLSQTCSVFAREYEVHRSTFLRQRITDLCPLYQISGVSPGSAHTNMKIWWPQGAAIRQLHALWTEPGAIESMWDATVSQLHGDVLLHGFQPKRWDRLSKGFFILQMPCRHASLTCDIHLHSSQPLYVSGNWLGACLPESVVSALRKVFTDDLSTFLDVDVNISRICARHQFHLFSEHFSCSDPERDFDMWSYKSWGSADPEGFVPVARHLPLSQQVFAITGDWSDEHNAELGQVAGDKVIDLPHLDQEFCTWQSWDADVWMYEPFTCEIAKERVWYYK